MSDMQINDRKGFRAFISFSFVLPLAPEYATTDSDVNEKSSAGVFEQN